MTHYLLCFLVFFFFACRKNENKDDDKRLISSDISSHSETTKQTSKYLRIGEAFLTCDTANDTLAIESSIDNISLTCEVIADAAIDDWQFFTKDLADSITEIDVAQHNEGSTIWRLSLPNQIIRKTSNLEIMIWSQTAEDAGFAMRGHNMHAIDSIPENRFAQVVQASSEP